MHDLGYGKGYRYAHDLEEGTADIDCLPERLTSRRYYEPHPISYEKEIGERLKETSERRRLQRGRRKENTAGGRITRRPRPTPSSG